MKPKYPLRAKNESGNTIVDIALLVVPDSAITSGSEVVDLGVSTGDVTGPSSAVSGNVATFNGTGGKTIQDGGMSLPASSGTLGYLNLPQVSFSAAYPIVATDAGKQLYHPASDANNRQVTIPANASIAFPLGTCITITNGSANNVTVVITSDTLQYVNVGTITTLTIPQYNTATIQKTTTTTWLASGSAGCTTA